LSTRARRVGKGKGVVERRVLGNIGHGKVNMTVLRFCYSFREKTIPVAG